MNLPRRAPIGVLKLIGLYHRVHDLRRERRFRIKSRECAQIWLAEGRPCPPPDSVKYECIRDYAKKFATAILVETGTFHGNAIFILRHVFREIHSIELSPDLYARAAKDMRHLPHIHLHQGDSATVLPRIASALNAPTLFWLDGHYCSGPSARGEKDTPVIEELTFLLSRPAAENVMLIDDARLFTGENGYPSIEWLRDMVAANRPQASLEVGEDIIRILPV